MEWLGTGGGREMSKQMYWDILEGEASVLDHDEGPRAAPGEPG